MRRPPRLERKPHRIEPRRRFIIFCEGKNTEPTYFQALKHGTRKALIEVEITGGCGVPYTIAEKASSEARRLGLYGKKKARINGSFEF
jgi:hypothetical protein